MVFSHYQVCDAEGAGVSICVERNIDTDGDDNGIADHCIKEI
jgi:hypothetical protein